MNKRVLFASAVTVLASVAAPALAQSNDVVTIEEVVVTAQRFSESAQKTPLIITALTDEALAGVTDVRQLQTLTPGISFSTANLTTTFVRGVGSALATNAQESAVAYNADGVFLFTSTMISPMMYDLERVEILKGPQGTLYGRNASGGAINLITRGASLEKVEGYAEGEVGNYDLRRLTAAVNVPLSDTFAVRLAGQHTEHEGYLSDGGNDQDMTSGRVRVLWQPSEGVALRLGADGSKARGMGFSTSVIPNRTGDDFVGALDPRVNNGVGPFQGGQSVVAFGPYAPSVQPPYFKDDHWSVFAQLDVDLGFANLTVLPAYRHEDYDQLSFTPGYYYAEKNEVEQKSFEARLAKQTDKLRWVVGAYYFDMDQTMNNTLRNDINFQGTVVTTPKSVESYAFFGEATFSVTDTFRLIGGLRYTHEESATSGTVNANLGPPGVINPITRLPNVQTFAYNPFNPFTNPTGELLDFPINSQSEADATTWKIGFEYDISEDSLLFATASKGFKGGGSYVDVPGAAAEFNPEFLTAYELGSRNRFFDNRLQVNGELFLWKLKDQQISFVGFNSLGNVSYLTVNAGSGEMYGANLDVIFKPTAADTLHFGVEYLHAEYESFVRRVPSLGILPGTACRTTGYNPTPGSTAPAVLDCSGLQMVRAPEWTLSGSYEHVFELGNGGNITAGVDGIYLGERWLDASYGNLTHTGSNTVWNASVTYNAPGDQWAVEAWIRNIGDEVVPVGVVQLFSFYGRTLLQPPQTYGVRAKFSF